MEDIEIISAVFAGWVISEGFGKLFAIPPYSQATIEALLGHPSRDPHPSPYPINPPEQGGHHPPGF